MTSKTKNAEAVAGFGVHKNLNKFLTAFNSNRNNEKFQCFNCQVWKRGSKFVAVGQFDEMTKQVFGFRFCRRCWLSYKSVSPELKQDFINNIRRKIKKAAEVKIDV